MNSRNNLLLQNTDKVDIPHRYFIVIGTFLSLFALGIVLTTFSVYFKPVSTQFGWTRVETSGAFSICLIVSGVMAIVSARLADKFSYRLVIISCGIISSCTCLLLSQMSTLWQLYFYYGILMGISLANIIPTTSLVTKCFKRQRGLMTGITMSGGPIGSLVSAPIITKLIDYYNWRTSFIITGIAVLMIIGISAIFLRDPARLNTSALDESYATQSRILKGGEINLRIAMLSGGFWIIGILFFCTNFTQQVIVVHLIPHLTDIGLAPIIAASVLSMANLGNAFGNFSTGRINDVIGSRLSMVGGMFIMLIGLLLLLFVTGDRVWVCYVFAVIFGLGWGGTAMLRSALVADLFGLHSHGTITGAILLVSNIGGSLSPLIAGYIFDVSGGYQIAFLISISTIIIALIMALLLKYKIVSNPE